MEVCSTNSSPFTSLIVYKSSLIHRLGKCVYRSMWCISAKSNTTLDTTRAIMLIWFVFCLHNA